jgi:hypothetical protein
VLSLSFIVFIYLESKVYLLKAVFQVRNSELRIRILNILLKTKRNFSKMVIVHIRRWVTFRLYDIFVSMTIFDEFCQKLSPLHRRRYQSLVIFCLFDFLLIDPTNYFCLCKFFAKSLKSEGERIEVKFWPSDMMKSGRGRQC